MKYIYPIFKDHRSNNAAYNDEVLNIPIPFITAPTTTLLQRGAGDGSIHHHHHHLPDGATYLKLPRRSYLVFNKEVDASRYLLEMTDQIDDDDNGGGLEGGEEVGEIIQDERKRMQARQLELEVEVRDRVKKAVLDGIQQCLEMQNDDLY